MLNQFMPPTTNVLYRVYKLHGIDIGTCFVVEVDSHDYLITAAHLIDIENPSFRLYFEGRWQSFPADLHSVDVKRDVAIFRPSQRLVPDGFPAELGYGGLTYGQHVFFLGFPYGDHGDTTSFDDRRFPFPFVKWGAISLLDFGSPSNTLFLDAMNNPGFSGGPVCFTTDSRQQKIAGMIIGMKEEERVIDDQSSYVAQKSYYKQNTGLTYAISAGAIIKQIRKHP